MNQQVCINIQKPRTDERRLWDIIAGTAAYRGLLVAHDLKLFSVLAEHPRTLAEVCNELNIDRRPAEALLAVLVSIGLVQVEEEDYSLTSLAEDYLLESSPTYFGGLLDMMIASDSVMSSFESLKKAVLTNSPQLLDSGKLFKSHEEQAARAHAFTYGMHGHSIAPALGWPEVIDLSGYSLLLDIGGGSGAHAIGATLKWPHLQAVVLDLLPVCDVAQEFVARYGLQGRIETYMGDMWSEPFPAADLHFYSNIYHDWPPEQGRFLTHKSFESLPSGGRIIIHEMLFDDQKTGPLAAAGFNIGLLMSIKGQQYSGHELSVMLTKAGFTDIEVKPSYGYWSIVTGRKP